MSWLTDLVQGARTVANDVGLPNLNQVSGGAFKSVGDYMGLPAAAQASTDSFLYRKPQQSNNLASVSLPGSAGYSNNSSIQSTGSNSGGGKVGNSGGKSRNKSSNSSGQQSAQEAALKKSLGSSFADIINTYGNQLKGLPTQQQQLQSQVSNLSDSQKQSINDALNSTLQTLANNRHLVSQYQNQTMNGIGQSMNQTLQAANNYLGSRGAANSSAANQYGAWLAQQAAQQRSQAQTNYAGQQNDINNQQVQAQSAAQQQLDAVNTWANQQNMGIVQKYQDLNNQLEQAKANVSDQEKQAIATLQQNLLISAQNQQNQLQLMAQQYQDQLGAQAQLGSLGAYNYGALQSALGNAVNNSNPTQVNAQGVQFTPQGQTQAQTPLQGTGGLPIPGNQQIGFNTNLPQNNNIGNQAYSLTNLQGLA